MEKIEVNKKESWLARMFNDIKTFLVSIGLVGTSALGKAHLAVGGYLEEQRKASQQKEITDAQEKCEAMIKRQALPIENKHIKNQNIINKKFIVCF